MLYFFKTFNFAKHPCFFPVHTFLCTFPFDLWPSQVSLLKISFAYPTTTFLVFSIHPASYVCFAIQSFNSLLYMIKLNLEEQNISSVVLLKIFINSSYMLTSCHLWRSKESILHPLHHSNPKQLKHRRSNMIHSFQ